VAPETTGSGGCEEVRVEVTAGHEQDQPAIGRQLDDRRRPGQAERPRDAAF
jgi:hypothetical protein